MSLRKDLEDEVGRSLATKMLKRLDSAEQRLAEAREASETFIRKADDGSLRWSETVAEFRAFLAALETSEQPAAFPVEEGRDG